MARMRKPFQGVTNILRFNRHFFVLALVAVVAIAWASFSFGGNIRLLGLGFIATLGGMIMVSLCVSYYIYDCSGLYQLAWLDTLAIGPGGMMWTIPSASGAQKKSDTPHLSATMAWTMTATGFPPTMPR